MQSLQRDGASNMPHQLDGGMGPVILDSPLQVHLSSLL